MVFLCGHGFGHKKLMSGCPFDGRKYVVRLQNNYARLKALANHVAINVLTVQYAEKELKIKSCFTVSNHPHF